MKEEEVEDFKEAKKKKKKKDKKKDKKEAKVKQEPGKRKKAVYVMSFNYFSY